jgi:radical SAM superfamily enzyme YgiQ (UPF0313 family)
MGATTKIWLADLTYTQQTVAADTIPMAIGCIAEYLEDYFPDIPAVQLFKYPDELISALASEPPNILGFSNYVWNFELSRELSRYYKHLNPQGIVIFGGPNYPLEKEDRKKFIEENNDIFDYYVSGEGELAFTLLVESLINQNFNKREIAKEQLGSIHFQYGGEVFLTPKHNRLKDLNTIPSPYTSGKLDKFFDGKLMPLLQTNRGCPFSCTFCVEGDDYYTKIRKYNPERVQSDVEYIGKKISETSTENSRKDLFIADSNFGMYPSDIDTAKALAQTKIEYAWPDYINVATGKNAKERVIETARILDGSLRLSGSVQSLDQDVLENIKRKNISPERLVELGLHTKTIGVNSYSEIILGLPGDSKEKHFQTIASVMDAGFNVILPWQLMMIHGSELSTPKEREKHGLVTKYRVLPRCYGHWQNFEGDFGNGSIKSVEIEEVCIASRTLSFDDYLECRVLNYFVATYYNDALFTPVITYLNSIGLRSFDFVKTLMETALSSDYVHIVDEFVNDTKDELWDDKEELRKFVMSGGNIDKYIEGDLGRNILFYHRAKAYCTHLEEMKRLVIESFEIITAGKMTDEQRRYGLELIEYCATLADGILIENFEALEKEFTYDFYEHVKSNNFNHSPVQREKYKYNFVFSADTRALVSRSLATHGNDLVGVARILSRIFVKKLYRSVHPLPLG